MKQRFVLILLLLSNSLFQFILSAQGTAFSYQGRLNDGSNPANGNYDFRFAIYDLAGGVIAGPITNLSAIVSNGLFTATLDFGNVFSGADRLLEIAVRTNGSIGFITLAPRQKLTPTPYAIVAGDVTAANIARRSGTNFFSDLNFLTNVNNVLAGNGVGLTALDAGQVASGTMADARLSGNVPLKSGANAFTGNNTFSQPVVVNPLSTTAIVVGTNYVGGAGGDITIGPMTGVRFWDTLGSFVGGMWMDTNHGGSFRSLELHIDSLGDISANTGYGNGGGRFQLSGSGYPGTLADTAPSQPVTVSAFHSGTAWDVAVRNNQVQTGWRTEGVGTNEPRWVLYVPMPTFTVGGHTQPWNNDGRIQIEARTNGVNLRGRDIHERRTATLTTKTNAIDFSKPSWEDWTAGAQQSLVCYTTNETGGGTDGEPKTLILRSGGIGITNIIWPSGWSVEGPSAGGSLPTTLNATLLLELRIKSVGLGETNKIVEYLVASDNSFAWDADALAFFSRAGISDSHKPLFNAFVITLKGITSTLGADGQGATTAWDRLDYFIPTTARMV